MAQLTIQQQLCAGLVALGFSELKPTPKYRVFDGSSEAFPKRRFFVGKAGALRTSFDGRVTSSFPSTELFRRRVFDAALAVGRK